MLLICQLWDIININVNAYIYTITSHLYYLQVLSHYPVNPLRKTMGENLLDKSSRRKIFIYIKHFKFYLKILINDELT